MTRDLQPTCGGRRTEDRERGAPEQDRQAAPTGWRAESIGLGPAIGEQLASLKWTFTSLRRTGVRS